MIFVIIAAIIILSLILFNVLLERNLAFYVFLYEHKDWKLWKKLNKLPVSSFKLVGTIPEFQTSYYTIDTFPSNWRLVVNNEDCFIADNDTNECVLSGYYKKGSYKLHKKLYSEIHN